MIVTRMWKSMLKNWKTIICLSFSVKFFIELSLFEYIWTWINKNVIAWTDTVSKVVYFTLTEKQSMMM